MDVIKIPYNAFIGIMRSDEANTLLMIIQNENNINHLGTLHASALFALAEASSGECLLREFNDLNNGILPVLRRSEVKYSKPGIGKIYSKANTSMINKNKNRDELKNKGRTMIEVEIELVNEKAELVMKSKYEWFVSMIK
ncbi:MAG: DUF4442 domain-containing protein [Dehalococcoidia bacterium]|nr:MAG: DUF4442 domain-containing protein [Dehalococcoidia bacterium]